MNVEFSRYIFEEYSNIKFHENPSSENRIVPCERKKDFTKLKSAFRKFAKFAKNTYIS